MKYFLSFSHPISLCLLLNGVLSVKEVRLVLEDFLYSTDLGNTSLLSACYAVMEKSIMFLSQQPDIADKSKGKTQENGSCEMKNGADHCCCDYCANP